MKVLDISALKPGKTVWLESYGYAFKALRLARVTIIAVTASTVYFVFPFCCMNRFCYNADLTWRCWDERPDLDTLAEADWSCAFTALGDVEERMSARFIS